MQLFAPIAIEYIKKEMLKAAIEGSTSTDIRMHPDHENKIEDDLICCEDTLILRSILEEKFNKAGFHCERRYVDRVDKVLIIEWKKER